MDSKHSNLDPQFGRSRDGFSQADKFLEPGIIYEGTVVHTNPPNSTVTVELDRFKGSHVSGCVWAAGVLSGMIGMRSSYTPPIQSRVLVVYTGKLPICIISCIPGPTTDVHAPTRKLLGTHKDYHNSHRFNTKTDGKAAMYNAAKPPIDLVEGEFQMDNLLGVGLSLLRSMSRLTAGDLAKVECHLLNDMVRIVSDTFRHHTAFGDYKISNDGGKLNVEWHGTSHDHEAWGLRKETDPKAEMAGTHRAKLPDGFLEDGRWRFSQYIGWLGNFIHMFVTDPQDAIGKIAQDQFRSGKAHLHVNNDGSVLIQSVADIVLEKVVRIPVPVRIRPEDDPNGNLAGQNLAALPLRTWVPSDNDNLFEMAFQLRDYARWLNNFYALGRYYQLNREFQVPKESEVPLPDMLSKDEEKKAANRDDQDRMTPTNWRMAYACYRIYRDGTVQHIDAYGNAYTSTQVGIQISSTSDILIQAAGNVNIVAGRDINLLARRNAAVTAVSGLLSLSAQKTVQVLAQTGKIILDTMRQGLVKVIGKLNVDGKAEIGIDGTINGTIVRGSMLQTVAGPMGDDGFYHATYGAPAVSSDADEFTHPEQPATAQYETLSQQELRQTGAGTEWNFEENEHARKGAPWPGKGAKQKVSPSTTTSLNTPATELPKNGSPKLEEKPMTLKCK